MMEIHLVQRESDGKSHSREEISVSLSDFSIQFELIKLIFVSFET